MAPYCSTLSDLLMAPCPACPAVLSSGIGVAGQALGAYLLSTEMIGPSWRGVAGILTQVCIDCIVCGILCDWQAMCLGISCCVHDVSCVILRPASISLASQS